MPSRLKPGLGPTVAEIDRLLSTQEVEPLSQRESKALGSVERVLETLYSRGSLNTTGIMNQTGFSSRTVVRVLYFCREKGLVEIKTRAHNEKLHTVNYGAARAFLLEKCAAKWLTTGDKSLKRLAKGIRNAQRPFLELRQGTQDLSRLYGSHQRETRLLEAESPGFGKLPWQEAARRITQLSRELKKGHTRARKSLGGAREDEDAALAFFQGIEGTRGRKPGSDDVDS